MKSYKKLLIACSLLVVLGAAGAVISLRGKQELGKDVQGTTNLQELRSHKVGLVIQRDYTLVRQAINKSNEQAGQLWELIQPRGSKTQFVVNAFYEQGGSLKKLTGFTKQSLRESVMINVNLQLPKQYPEYKEITQRNLTVNDVEANETIFDYVSSGIKIRQRLLLLFKNSDTVVYVRAQAKANEYSKINQRYFDSLYKSVRFD